MRQVISLVLAAAMVATGVAAAGYFASQTILNGQVGANTAAVKGLSERIVPADKGEWALGYAFTGRDPAEVATLFTRAEELTTRMRGMLTAQGFPEADIYAAPLVKRDITERSETGQIIDRYFIIEGTISVSTNQPGLIEPARAPLTGLAREGFSISENNLAYSFTRLNEIKPDMLREATENARVAADEFARNAGVKVGGIRDAMQGGFEITDPPGTSPGSAQKLVRVVTNITFYLEN